MKSKERSRPTLEWRAGPNIEKLKVEELSRVVSGEQSCGGGWVEIGRGSAEPREAGDAARSNCKVEIGVDGVPTKGGSWRKSAAGMNLTGYFEDTVTEMLR